MSQRPCLAMDMMQTEVIAARPEMTCEELQEMLVMNRISGAPVIDASGRLLGVISMSDILNAGLNLPYSADFYENARLDLLLEKQGLHLETITSGFVEDYMTHRVMTAYPHARVEELAEMMYNNHIHRVIIVRPQDNAVAGIVTAFDLLRLIKDQGLRCEVGTQVSACCGAD
ncbi:MAG TPA: CBS domain-containing protein [Coleofasciculaceae cyanobacterium]